MAKPKTGKDGKPTGKPITGRRRKGRPSAPASLPRTRLQVDPPKRTDEHGNPPTPTEGNVIQLHEKIRRASELRAYCYDVQEICQIIGREFECDPPEPPTVYGWFNKYHHAADADIINNLNERRQQVDRMITALLKRWMPVAAAEKLMINRWQTMDGMKVPVLDENAYDEQLKASAIVLKAMERLCKLWNLDLSSETGGKPLTPQAIALIISQQVNNHYANGGPVGSSEAITLELTAGGDHDLDQL